LKIKSFISCLNAQNRMVPGSMAQFEQQLTASLWHRAYAMRYPLDGLAMQ
jgi:hypothetical protein